MINKKARVFCQFPCKMREIHNKSFFSFFFNSIRFFTKKISLMFKFNTIYENRFDALPPSPRLVFFLLKKPSACILDLGWHLTQFIMKKSISSCNYILHVEQAVKSRKVKNIWLLARTFMSIIIRNHPLNIMRWLNTVDVIKFI